MQSEKMQIQLCPQLTAIQEQLKSVIANHQVVFRRYQNDPENVELRDKLEEMVLQIKNLSNHQTVLVKQLRENVAQNTSVAPNTTTITTTLVPAAVAAASAAHSVASTPFLVTPNSVAAARKPMGTLSPRPHLVTLQPHSIVVPFAHVQGQATLMSIPGFLAQSGNTLMAPASSLVNLQLSAAPVTATAILTTPTPPTHAPVSTATTKSGPASVMAVACSQKNMQPVPQLVKPRRASPPIKVPQYTANHHSNTQGDQANSGSAKSCEKSNSSIQRSYSEGDAKEAKRLVDHSVRDVRRTQESRIISTEDKKKQEFMICLGLVTQDSLKDLQNRRAERKRRSTANPNYSYTLDLDKKRNGSHSNGYLMGGLGEKRPRGRPPRPSPSPSNSCPPSPGGQDKAQADNASATAAENKEVCVECAKGGQLLLCGTCSLVYHLDCLSPPLAAAPPSPWSCPACIVSGKRSGTLSNGALTMINSYISCRANKYDDKQKLQKKSMELVAEKEVLLEKRKALKQKIEEKQARCEELKDSANEKSAAVDTLKSFIKSFQEAPTMAAAPAVEPSIAPVTMQAGSS